jgi:hypothetical protein
MKKAGLGADCLKLISRRSRETSLAQCADDFETEAKAQRGNVAGR